MGRIVNTGLDRLLESPSRLEGRRFALLAHGASVTGDGEPANLALTRSGFRPAALFGPEHGYYGVEQDMVAAAGGSDPWTGAPLVSLYGDDEASLRPSPAAFSGLDLLVVDLQDVGSRYYTYAATAVWAGEAAAAAGCEVWILDRPNPLGGVVVEGNLLQKGFESFVGAFQTPVRHGLTLGELVRLQAQAGGWSDALEVWTLSGWHRSMQWSDCSLPWIAPSPNMPTPATAVLYPGGCLVEATEISEGRGTTRPFHLVGAPHLDPLDLEGRLMERQLPGVRFVPTYFRPQFQKHAGAICGGVEILVQDVETFHSYRTGVELLAALRECSPEDFLWRHKPYEFVSELPAVDLLTGSGDCRQAVEEGGASRERLDSWLVGWEEDEAAFREICRPILLYGDGSFGGEETS